MQLELNSRFWESKTLPVILQSELSECGLACLAMVSNYWGHRVDMYTLRRKLSVSIKGTSLNGLIAAAKKLNLQPRPVKLGVELIKDLKLPAVLHWDMNHFVVLRSVAAGKVVIHDPAVGERTITLDEFGKHFTGVAMELTPTKEFTRQNAQRSFSLRELMGHVVGLKRSLGQLVVMGVALQILVLAMPFYTQWLLDEALVASDRDLVTVLGLAFLALVVIQAMITGVRAWITTSMATSLNHQWLSNAFAHLLKLPIDFFEKRHLGDIVSRFGSIKTIQNAITTQFVEGVIDGALVVTTLAAMFLYSPLLASVAVLASCLYVLLRMAVFKRQREATIEQITHGAKQQSHFMESARGIQAIRLFGKDEERRMGWTNLLTDEFNAGLRVSRVAVTFQTANFLIFNIERVVIIWIAALAVIDAKFSIGMMVAFIAYEAQFSQRVGSLVDKLFEFRMLKLHGERVADLVLTEAEQETGDFGVDVRDINPEIEFKNVSFRYADGEPWVLHKLDLFVPKGQCIAIAGPSGGGKTTLVKLMLGLLEPTEGEILIGGVEIRKLGLTTYRGVIGAVMQNDSLFAGSVADNISFFDQEPQRDRIEAAARVAAIHDEICAMPMGYNTLAGDMSSGMSGGQMQRILLARALYKAPKILVMDEATSHLDVGNERMVNTGIKNAAELTRIVVAHRPETLAMADRIVVLHQGRIAQDMTPAQAGLAGPIGNGSQSRPATVRQKPTDALVAAPT